MKLKTDLRFHPNYELACEDSLKRVITQGTYWEGILGNHSSEKNDLSQKVLR